MVGQPLDILLQDGENGSLSYSLLQIVLWIQENKGFNILAAQTIPLPLYIASPRTLSCKVLPFGLGEVFCFCFFSSVFSFLFISV